MSVALLMDIAFGRTHLLTILLKKSMMSVLKSKEPKVLTKLTANLWRQLASRASTDLIDVNDLFPNGGLITALQLLKHQRAQRNKGKKEERELDANLEAMAKFVHEVLLEFNGPPPKSQKQ